MFTRVGGRALVVLVAVAGALCAVPATALQVGLDRFCAEVKVNLTSAKVLDDALSPARAARASRSAQFDLAIGSTTTVPAPALNFSSMATQLKESDARLVALAPAELATPIRIVAAKNSWTLAELAAVNYEIAKLDRKRLLKISYDSQFNTSWYRYTLFARRACGIEKLK